MTLVGANESRAFNYYRTGLRQHSPIRDINPANKFEASLPNRDANYEKSPAAKRARQDGSLDALATMNRTFNRKIKMRDTFTKLFPCYEHGSPTCYQSTKTHMLHQYPDQDDEGRPTHAIDRTYTHKKDEMKNYTECMLKI